MFSLNSPKKPLISILIVLTLISLTILSMQTGLCNGTQSEDDDLVVMIMFDDGRTSVFENGTYLRERETKIMATCSGHLDDEDFRPTFDDYHEILDDVIPGAHSHSHPDFSEISESEARDEIETEIKMYIENGIPLAEMYTWTYGSVAHLDIVKEYYNFAYGIRGGDRSDRWNIQRPGVDSSDDDFDKLTSDIQSYIDDDDINGLMWMGHDIIDADQETYPDTGITTQLIEDILDYIDNEDGVRYAESWEDFVVNAYNWDRDPITHPTQAVEIYGTSATLEQEIVTLGDYDSAEILFKYRKTEDTDWKTSDRIEVSESGRHEIDITGLEENSDYEFKATIIWGTEYTSPITQTFTTNEDDNGIILYPDDTSQYIRQNIPYIILMILIIGVVYIEFGGKS